MSTESTQAVIDHHSKALLAGDLDAVMDDYTEDSMFISNLGGVMKGLAAIRSRLAAGGAFPGFETTSELIEGECAYNTWKMDGIKFASDTFVVRDGKIVVQTVAMVFE